ncbi:unnamed protein product [Allacma fusca]|uniref:Uncharacterized protein n=1 Tax=Allacma fusca TaxID=39272 RepID=A0A8J2K049_9HEXA|nr:unnamed protein product [Allacma fusca]
MASLGSYGALKEMKLEIEHEKIELAEMRDRLQATDERCGALEKEIAEMEAEIKRTQQHTEVIRSIRAARAAEVAKMRHYRHNEQLPRLEALRERLKRRLEMREMQQILFEKQDAALENAIRQQQDYQNSLPKIARRNELRAKYAKLCEENRIQTEVLEEKKALLADRRKKNMERWDQFVKWCIKAAENWKAREEAERLKKLEEEKRVQEILTKSKSKQVNFVKPFLQETTAMVRSGLSVSLKELELKKSDPSNEFSSMVSTIFSKSHASSPKSKELQPKFHDLWENFNKQLVQDMVLTKIPSPAKSSRPAYLEILNDLRTTKTAYNTGYSQKMTPGNRLESQSSLEVNFSQPVQAPTCSPAAANQNTQDVIQMHGYPPAERYDSIEDVPEPQNQWEQSAGKSGGFESPEVPPEKVLSPTRSLIPPSKSPSPIRLPASVGCTDTDDTTPGDIFKTPIHVTFMEQTSNRRQEYSPAKSFTTVSQSQASFLSQRSTVSDSPRLSRFVSPSDHRNTLSAASSVFASPGFESSQSTSYDFFGARGGSPVAASTESGMGGFVVNFGEDSSDNDGFNLGLDQETFNFDVNKDGSGAFF